MKSAYEIAMEKLKAAAGPSRNLSDDQKARLSEIGRIYDAKVAEAELAYGRKLAAASPADEEDLRQEMTTEIGRLQEKREREQEAVWNEAGE